MERYMNKQVLCILNRQEQEDRDVWQSKALFHDMICRDFMDGEAITHLYADFDVLAGLPAWAYAFPTAVRNAGIPVRTGRIFAVHKHTLCQVPYWHTHDFYELIHVLCGSCTQQLEHWTAPLVLQERQACLLRPGDVHCLSPCGPKDVILKFTIPVALFSEVPLGAKEAALLSEVCIYNARSPHIDFLIYTLLKESAVQGPLWNDAVISYLSALLVELSREPDMCHSTLLHQLAEYLDCCSDGGTLGGFAAFVGYSPHYAAHLLKEQTSKSFQELTVSFKMERARKMFVESSATVAEIAHALGYNSASGLYKQFLSAYGMTPTAYRKLFAAENHPVWK